MYNYNSINNVNGVMHACMYVYYIIRPAAVQFEQWKQ